MLQLHDDSTCESEFDYNFVEWVENESENGMEIGLETTTTSDASTTLNTPRSLNRKRASKETPEDILIKSASNAIANLQKNNKLDDEITSFSKYVSAALSTIKDQSIVDNFCSKTIENLFEAKKQWEAKKNSNQNE